MANRKRKRTSQKDLTNEEEDLNDLDPPFVKYYFSPSSEQNCNFLVGNPQSRKQVTIKAHRISLMAHSEAFRRMLDPSNPIAERGIIKIPDIQPYTFRNLLRFVYGHNIISKLSMEQAIDLLCAAEKYLVDELKSAVGAHTVSMLRLENIFIFLHIPECFEYEALKAAVSEIVQNNTKYLLEKEEFLTLEWFGVNVILSQEAADVGEIELWRAVLRWARHHAKTDETSELRKLLSHALKFIRFCSMDWKDFNIEVCSSNIFTHQEVSLINKSLASTTVQQELTTVCNTTKPRGLTSPTVKLDLAKQNVFKNNQSSHFFILTKGSQILLVKALLRGNNHSLGDFVPENLKYKFTCNVSVTRITDFYNDTSSEKPVVFQFVEDVEYGKNIVIPLKVGRQNIVLLKNNKYKIEFNCYPAHPTCCHKSLESTIITNHHLRLQCGSFTSQGHSNNYYGYSNTTFYGSHVTELTYRPLKD